MLSAQVVMEVPQGDKAPCTARSKEACLDLAARLSPCYARIPCTLLILGCQPRLSLGPQLHPALGLEEIGSHTSRTTLTSTSTEHVRGKWYYSWYYSYSYLPVQYQQARRWLPHPHRARRREATACMAASNFDLKRTAPRSHPGQFASFSVLFSTQYR